MESFERNWINNRTKYELIRIWDFSLFNFVPASACLIYFITRWYHSFVLGSALQLRQCRLWFKRTIWVIFIWLCDFSPVVCVVAAFALLVCYHDVYHCAICVTVVTHSIVSMPVVWAKHALGAMRRPRQCDRLARIRKTRQQKQQSIVLFLLRNFIHDTKKRTEKQIMENSSAKCSSASPPIFWTENLHTGYFCPGEHFH